jgi:hypothetical protein
MRARDGDAKFQPHEFGEHFCARDHRNLFRFRSQYLRVLRQHGRGYDHHLRFSDMRRQVADKDAASQLFQAAGCI